MEHKFVNLATTVAWIAVDQIVINAQIAPQMVLHLDWIKVDLVLMIVHAVQLIMIVESKYVKLAITHVSHVVILDQVHVYLVTLQVIKE